MAVDRNKMIRGFVTRPTHPRYASGKRGTRITEDDPRWNASTMGDKTGYYKGRWYSKGKKVPFDMRGQ